VPCVIEIGLLDLKKIKTNQCIFTVLLLSPLVEDGCPSFEEF
jgi:hypothetical protein